jgi:hypothetical protein
MKPTGKAILFLLALTLLLVPALAACREGSTQAVVPPASEASGAPESPEASEPATSEAPAAEAASEAPAEDRANWLVDEPVTLRWLQAARGWATPVQGNPIADEIYRRTGIRIEFEGWSISSDEEYRKRLNLWAASGDFGDYDVLLMENDAYSVSIFNTMGEMGYIWSLDDIIPKHAAFQAFVKDALPKFRDVNDGKVYGYPYHIIPMNTEYDGGITVRYDIMQELGLDFPTTMEEFYQMLKTVKEKAVGDDGKPIIPLSMGEDWFQFGYLTAQFFGEDNSWEQDADGQWVMPMYSDMEKSAYMVAFMNRLWNEGLLDSEFFSNKREPFTQKCSSGRVFATFSLRIGDLTSVNDALMAGNPDKFFTAIPAIPAPGVNAADVHIKIADAFGSGFNIFPKNTVTEEKLEAFFKYADWVLGDEGTILTKLGIEGQHWNYDENGKCVDTPEWAAEMAGNQNIQQESGLWHYQSAAGNWFRADKFIPGNPLLERRDSAIGYANVKDMTGYRSQPVYAVFAGEIEQTREPQLRDAWRQLFVKAVMAPSGEEAAKIWSDWEKTAQDLGYQEMLDERNELTRKVVEAGQ